MLCAVCVRVVMCVFVNIARTAEEIFTKCNITEILPAHSNLLESDNNESSDGVDLLCRLCSAAQFSFTVLIRT